MGTVMVSREELLSRCEVASLLGVSVETMKGWARRGIGPEFSRSGPVRGRVWYQAADVVAWLEAQKRRRSIGAEAAAGNATNPVGGSRSGVASEENQNAPMSTAERGGHDEKPAGVFHAAKEAES